MIFVVPPIFFAAVWNKYDGVAFLYVDSESIVGKVKDTWKSVKSYFTKDKTAEYRTRALICFLPKWEGFVVTDEGAEQMNATVAIVKLRNVVQCVSNVWTEESGHCEKRKPSNFYVGKVISPLYPPRFD